MKLTAAEKRMLRSIRVYTGDFKQVFTEKSQWKPAPKGFPQLMHRL